MQAYVEKHPRMEAEVWYPSGFPSDWAFVRDLCGKVIVGRAQPLEVGKSFELWTECMVPHHRGKTLPMLGFVVARVSMRAAMKLAGSRLRHKPYCYEVIVD